MSQDVHFNQLCSAFVAWHAKEGILIRITGILTASAFLLPTEWYLPWNDLSLCYLFLACCSWDPGCFGNSLFSSSWRVEKGRRKKEGRKALWDFTGVVGVRLRGGREECEEKMCFPFSAFTGTDQIMLMSVLSSAHHWHVRAKAFALVLSHCLL